MTRQVTPCMDCGGPANSVRCGACCNRLRNGRPWRRMQRQVFAEETHCWICYQYVDQTLPAGEPRSRSVDHVHALRDGGPPLERNNCRLAHVGCNSVRSNQARGSKHRPTLIVDPATI